MFTMVEKLYTCNITQIPTLDKNESASRLTMPWPRCVSKSWENTVIPGILGNPSATMVDDMVYTMVDAMVDAMVDTMVDAMVAAMVSVMVDSMVDAMGNTMVDAMVDEPPPARNNLTEKRYSTPIV